ncbi:hypothetical protein ACH36K_02570 [Clostridium sp. MB05]|jgi:hypothetical protein|uniref:hypothetical protein n=1 Tax=Clostridium sp. MB05 TaxID=3376682 RepID=UPI003981E68C
MIQLKKPIKNIITILVIILSVSLTSCGVMDNIKGKFKRDNGYFDYLGSGKVDVISIQSVRDKSFKFIVTDDKAILSMYELLSKAKVSEKKSDLQPDYIFEIKIGDEVKKFNYIVGAYDGNFYDENMSFTVSKRLDESIIQNLSIIRKPRDFEYIYYNSILEVMNRKKKELNDGNNKVGIDIQGDIDCLKYIFSADIEDFLERAKKITPNVEMVENNESEFDIVIKVKNRGHNSTVYKSNITVEDKKNKLEDYYYVVGENEFKEWNIDIYSKKDVPKEVEKNW